VAGYEQAAGDFLRRLIPFPGADVLTPLSPLSLTGQSAATQANPVNAVTDAVSEQAASIVAQAASVLDDEMAKGVFAARRTGATGSYGQMDAANPVLRQMHEVVENLAALWPTLQASQTQKSVGSPPTGSYVDPLAEVRPRATVKPGQRATISMTLRNTENRAVQLTPAATDLLGSRSGRISCSLLEFTPSALTLEPQDQRDLAIATTVPVDATPGCYSGLLVVRGLDYLRALITIEVA
jgi:hypothetical protein